MLIPPPILLQIIRHIILIALKGFLVGTSIKKSCKLILSIYAISAGNNRTLCRFL